MVVVDMFPALRVVAGLMAAGGFLAGAPAVAQVVLPSIELGDALRAGVATVPAEQGPSLKVATATSLLDAALRDRGYTPVTIGECRHSRPTVVVCNVDLALDDTRWQGTGGVRLLRRGGARVRYSIRGVG